MTQVETLHRGNGSVLSLLGSHGDDPLGSDSHWDVVKQRLGKLLLHRLNVSLVQVCPQQSDAAVDVKTYTAWGEHGHDRRQIDESHLNSSKSTFHSVPCVEL